MLSILSSFFLRVLWLVIYISFRASLFFECLSFITLKELKITLTLAPTSGLNLVICSVLWINCVCKLTSVFPEESNINVTFPCLQFTRISSLCTARSVPCSDRGNWGWCVGAVSKATSSCCRSVKKLKARNDWFWLIDWFNLIHSYRWIYFNWLINEFFGLFDSDRQI